MSGFTVARLIAAAMLVVAVGRHPYSYYTLMRFAVCIVAAYGGFRSSERHQQGWMWMFGGIAVLFNPFIPVHLDRSTWAVLDVAAAGVFVASLMNRRLVQQEATQSSTLSVAGGLDQVHEPVGEAERRQASEPALEVERPSRA